MPGRPTIIVEQVCAMLAVDARGDCFGHFFSA